MNFELFRAVKEKGFTQRSFANDDDYATKGNPGISKTTEAVKAVNEFLAFPVFPDAANRQDTETDFNDLSWYKPNLVRLRIDSAQAPAKKLFENYRTLRGLVYTRTNNVK